MAEGQKPIQIDGGIGGGIVPDVSRAGNAVSDLAVRPPRRVFVRDLEILASVGIFEIEIRYEQRIIVGLELDVKRYL